MVLVATAAALVTTAPVAAGIFVLGQAYHVRFNRERLPDLDAFVRFDFPTIGHINDRNGQSLGDFARESRQITPYAEIPPIVRDAILAAEDKRFFSHDGVDLISLSRVLGKVRLGVWAARLATGGRHDNSSGRAIFPQGGSTITQQLVRGVFLQRQTSRRTAISSGTPASSPASCRARSARGM